MSASLFQLPQHPVPAYSPKFGTDIRCRVCHRTLDFMPDQIVTEERAALHTLLRGTAHDELPALADEVNATLSRMRAAIEAIHSGDHVGASDQRFTDVINIGIGGSDLGPRMVCRALDDISPKLKTHFISNVDPHDLDVATRDLNPQTTLLVICSKTFTTEETLTNAQLARSWLIDGGGS